MGSRNSSFKDVFEGDVSRWVLALILGESLSHGIYRSQGHLVNKSKGILLSVLGVLFAIVRHVLVYLFLNL